MTILLYLYNYAIIPPGPFRSSRSRKKSPGNPKDGGPDSEEDVVVA
jgi:hypothetical protein